MNIQQNKSNLAAKTIMVDGDYQSKQFQLLGNVAIQAMKQGQAMRINALNEREDQQAASNVAVQNAEGEGMEKAQMMQDERLAQAERARPKTTIISQAAPQKKSNLIRNALIIGGASSFAIVGGSTLFPLLFGKS